jgi:hypothetical protein
MSWQPQQDHDYWGPDGQPAYHGHPDTLRWRIVGPNGFSLDTTYYGEEPKEEPIRTRRDAISEILEWCDVGTFRALDKLDHEIAGWDKISCGAWSIEPIGKAQPHG